MFEINNIQNTTEAERGVVSCSNLLWYGCENGPYSPSQVPIQIYVIFVWKKVKLVSVHETTMHEMQREHLF